MSRGVPLVPAGEFVLFLSGGDGVGESTTLDHIGDGFARQRRPSALMDVDWFHRSWPVADSDAGNVLVEAATMSAVRRNHRASGARQLVVSGVLASGADVARSEAAFEMPIRAALLTAGQATTEARLRARYGGARRDALAWRPARFQRIARELEPAGRYEAVVLTDGRAPADVAAEVLQRIR